MGRLERRAVLTGLALGVWMLMAGCQAPLEQKRGGSGEICNGDDTQCRQGLVCEKGVCQSINNSDEICPKICDKFRECNAAMQNCYADCVATLRDWSEENTQTYGDCYQNDVSCSEIQSSQNPQNICYSRLDLPAARKERCKTLRDTARSCLSNTGGDYDAQITNFYDSCLRRGRTVSDQRWKATKKCENYATADPPQCGNMFACINENFRLQEDFPTQRPGQ
ncbi:MAG: hypothetical protein ABEN55_00885 [Bradymonadaceae bacterium]